VLETNSSLNAIDSGKKIELRLNKTTGNVDISMPYFDTNKKYQKHTYKGQHSYNLKDALFVEKYCTVYKAYAQKNNCIGVSLEDLKDFQRDLDASLKTELSLPYKRAPKSQKEKPDNNEISTNPERAVLKTILIQFPKGVFDAQPIFSSSDVRIVKVGQISCTIQVPEGNFEVFFNTSKGNFKSTFSHTQELVQSYQEIN
jgi:hypothetical protein